MWPCTSSHRPATTVTAASYYITALERDAKMLQHLCTARVGNLICGHTSGMPTVFHLPNETCQLSSNDWRTEQQKALHTIRDANVTGTSYYGD